MAVCTECGSAVGDAVWCGSCGARVAGPGDGARSRGAAPSPTDVAPLHTPPAEAALVDDALIDDALIDDVRRVDGRADARPVDAQLDEDAPRGRRWSLVAVAALVGGLAVATTVGGPSTDERPSAPSTSSPSAGAAGDDGAPDAADDLPGRSGGLVASADPDDLEQRVEPFGLRVAWVRQGVATVTTGDIDVRPAGPAHVVVDGRVVATTGRRDPQVLWFPREIRETLGPGGRWAVAEAGSVLFGAVDGPATRVTVAGGWTPVGVPETWVDGEPVFGGVDGRLGRIARGGEVRWVTDAPVNATSVRPGELVGLDAGSSSVVVSLDDGATTRRPFGDRPAVLHVAEDENGPLTVTVDAGGSVVGDPGGDGEPWERRVGTRIEGVSITGDGVVVLTLDGVVLLDPTSGATIATIDGVGAPTVGGAVVVADDAVALRRWDGGVAWRQGFDEREVVAVRAVDGRRVAVELALPDGGSLVTVLDEQGSSLAATRGIEPSVPRTATIAEGPGDLVGVVGAARDEARRPTWVTAGSGRDGLADATVAINGAETSVDWRYAGSIPSADGPAQVVRVRDRDDQTLVQVGDRTPVALDAAGDELDREPAVVGASHVAFSTIGPGGRAFVVDVRSGQVTDVGGVVAEAVVEEVVVARSRRPATGPFRDGPRALVAVRAGSGRDLWRHALVGTVGPGSGGPAITATADDAGGSVLETGAATMRLRSLRDGDVRWSVAFDAPLTAPPVIAGDAVVVAVADGTVRTLRLADGGEEGSTVVGHVTALRTDPERGRTALGTVDGRVGLLDADGLPAASRAVYRQPVADLRWRRDVLVVLAGENLLGLTGR